MIQEVIYLGMVTRWLVLLESGERVNVARQNHQRSTATATDRIGDHVQITWDPRHSQKLDESLPQEED